MNTYIVLLKRMEVAASRVEDEPPTPRLYNELAAHAGVELESAFITVGIFDAVVVCRAGSNQAVAQFLDGLSSWHADCMVAAQRLEFKSLSE